MSVCGADGISCWGIFSTTFFFGARRAWTDSTRTRNDGRACGGLGLLLLEQADNVKRTFDYAPFIREFVAALQREGRWDEVLAEGGGAEARAPTAETGTPKAKRARKKKA